MIIVNGVEVKQERFGDGTLKCEALLGGCIHEDNEIRWLYDNDSELFTLYCVVRDIQNRMHHARNILYMPYIPHARQDRNVSGRLFTLKSFAEIINSLNFSIVVVQDPHSDVSTALLDRCLCEYADALEYEATAGAEAIMFPDAGAAKKYSRCGLPAIIGNKHRNEEGRIDSYELLNFEGGTKRVVIRDDICSYGGTFVAAAKALRERGVEHITLIVSHCENNILKGEVFNYIDKVITTDSICTIEHPKLEIAVKYRTTEGYPDV